MEALRSAIAAAQTSASRIANPSRTGIAGARSAGQLGAKGIRKLD